MSEIGQEAGVTETMFQARLVAIHHAAHNINIYEFARVDGAALFDVDPGAHIDIALPNGITRQYSLISPGRAPNRYVVAVKRDPHSRGGSRFMHDELRVGQIVSVSRPRNNFRLEENAEHLVLIAGGIGITPIWAMIQRLLERVSSGRSWTLHYSCRTRAEAAFLSALEHHAQVHLNFDAESSRTLDVDAIVRGAPGDAHLYCCGPAPMLAAFEAATANLPAERKHVEYFSSKAPPALASGFVIELRRSGKELVVPPGRSILSVLRDAGVHVAFSCEQGICGSCETRILSGVPDHRDSVLSAAERAANETMMICCSGSRTDRLALDV
jgi:tetrachlorobenzoquinone reductase